MGQVLGDFVWEGLTFKSMISLFLDSSSCLIGSSFCDWVSIVSFLEGSELVLPAVSVAVE